MGNSSTARRIITGFVVLLGVVAAGFLIFAWRPAIDPIEPPPASSFDSAVIRRGAQLAALGDCTTCHTARGATTFAGGRALQTPFGTTYSTNITPDPQTGIGRWSQAAFLRAMREGVDRAGHHLYPAFPYDHFTLVTDGDNAALYAFFMTRQPVKAEVPANQLPFPLNVRPFLAVWKLLYLRKGPYTRDPGHDEVWNRGAYLVNGLAHCGACHTPRNLLGAEKKSRHLAGGEAEGWYAYAINSGSQSPVPWDVNSLDAYLRNGWHAFHGVARGPMISVPENLSSVPDADIRAIATYIVSVMGTPTPERRERGEALASSPRANGPGTEPQSAGSQTIPATDAMQTNDPGAAIYAVACAPCHESGRPMPFGGINLALSIGVSGEKPTNLIHVTLEGLSATGGSRAPVMPGFSSALSDQQLVSLLTYLRSRFADKPVWADLETTVRDTRKAEHVAPAQIANIPTSAAAASRP